MKVKITRTSVIEMSREAFEFYSRDDDTLGEAIEKVDENGDWKDAIVEAETKEVKQADWDDPEGMDEEDDDDGVVDSD